MNNRLVFFFALFVSFSGFSSIVSATNPITPGVVDSGTAIDFSNFNFNGKKWEETSSVEILRYYWMRVGQEQLQGNTGTTSGTTPVNTYGTTPVTTTSETPNVPVTTSGSTLMTNPIPPPIKSIFLKPTGTTIH